MTSSDRIRELFDGAEIVTEAGQDEAVFETVKTVYVRTASRRKPEMGGSIMKRPITKVAIAAAILIGVGIGIQQLGGGTPVFADVVRPILQAHTATFKLVMSAPGQPVTTAEGQFMDPGLGRHVIRVDGKPEVRMIVITDYVNGKALLLNPSTKTAMAVELQGRTGELEPGKSNVFKALRDRLRTAQESLYEPVEYIGRSEIDGRGVIGYRLTEGDTLTTVWADANSLLPSQVEFTATGPSGPPTTATMMDIEFNVPLNPRVFSTEVPDGYTTSTIQADTSAPTEADLVETLRISVEITGGKFPVDLTPASMAQLAQLHMESQGLELSEETDLSDPAFREWIRIFQRINRGLKFVRGLPDAADWHYAGAEAIFGDKTAPICWYRPDGSETYRVVYADLSVLDATPEELALLQDGADR